MLKLFEQKFIVELSDITPTFGMKPTSIFKYYQETFARYCAKYNVAGYNLYKIGLKWVFGQTIAEYFDIIPIWNEEITAKVYISNVKKIRFYLNFEILTKRGLVAKGQSVVYVLDIETSRPQSVERIVESFSIDEENKNGEIIKTDFEEISEILCEKTHRITVSDLDFNGHTNNISYILFGFKDMPSNYINDKYPKIIDVRYLQETFLNDRLKCEICKKENSFEYKITNNKDNSEVCIVKALWTNNNMKPDDFFEALNEINSGL